MYIYMYIYIYLYIYVAWSGVSRRQGQGEEGPARHDDQDPRLADRGEEGRALRPVELQGGGPAQRVQPAHGQAGDLPG